MNVQLARAVNGNLVLTATGSILNNRTDNTTMMFDNSIGLFSYAGSPGAPVRAVKSASGSGWYSDYTRSQWHNKCNSTIELLF